jgi:hypothetical protein
MANPDLTADEVAIGCRNRRRARPAPSASSRVPRRRTARSAREGQGPQAGSHCRIVPDCEYVRHYRREIAHARAKGIGGDHGNRSTADQMISGCFMHHQGPRSLHSGHIRIECLEPENGTNGPIETYDREDNTIDVWRLLMRESKAGVIAWRRTE